MQRHTITGLLWNWGSQAGRHHHHSGQGRSMRMEVLEPRQLLAVDTISPAPSEPIPGDVNLDGVANQQDMAELAQEGKYLTGQPATWSEGDFDGDGVFGPSDLVLVLQRGSASGPTVELQPGDANGDGRFDRADVIQMLQEGRYQTGQPATWSQGDFDGNALFDHMDLVLALQHEYKGPAVVNPRAGDVNGDGSFNRMDIVSIAQAGKYGTGLPADWQDGDFDGSGAVDRMDFVTALQAGDYTP